MQRTRGIAHYALYKFTTYLLTYLQTGTYFDSVPQRHIHTHYSDSLGIRDASVSVQSAVVVTFRIKDA